MEHNKQTFTQEYLQNREQLKELPMVHKLLPLTDKSVRKLELKNLQAAIDKRDFDLELEERSIYQSIKLISDNVRQLMGEQDKQVIAMVRDSIEKFRQENVARFDEMNTIEEKFDTEVVRLTKNISELTVNDTGLESISDDEFEQIEEEETERVQSNILNETPVQSSDLCSRVEEIDAKLKVMGGPKGKWLESDHRQFVKVYNRCKGSEDRIIKGCIEILGMNNMEIIEHLEHYEKYLELDSEKKILAAEYKRNKEQKQQEEKLAKEAEEKRVKELLIKKRIEEAAERERKKQQVKQYKQRKLSEERKVDQEQLTKLKQGTIAKEARRTQSLAKNKKKLEEHAGYKAQEQKKLAELNMIIKAKSKMSSTAQTAQWGKPPVPKPQK